MDEYLFITMAKLKADRLKLEREQRAARVAEEPRPESVETHRRSARTSWFSGRAQWKEQS